MVILFQYEAKVIAEPQKMRFFDRWRKKKTRLPVTTPQSLADTTRSGGGQYWLRQRSKKEYLRLAEELASTDAICAYITAQMKLLPRGWTFRKIGDEIPKHGWLILPPRLKYTETGYTLSLNNMLITMSHSNNRVGALGVQHCAKTCSQIQAQAIIRCGVDLVDFVMYVSDRFSPDVESVT